MSRNTPSKQSLAAREVALYQRLFGADWERAALRIRQLAAMKHEYPRANNAGENTSRV